VTPERQALAEKALAEAARLQPELAETQLARAYLQYWVRRDYKRALEMMQQLRTSWPNNSEVLEGMAYISARLGQWKEALYYMEQAAALNPKDASIRLQAIGIALAMRDFPKAIMMADKVLPLWPDDSNLLGLKASAFQAQGQLDEAQSILSHVFLKTSDLDLGSVVLMYQTVLRHDRVAAGKLLDSSPQALQSNDPWFLLQWATVQETAGRQEDARTSLTRARDTLETLIKAQPQKGDLVGILAMILAALEQRENALKALEQFTAMRPGDARQAAKQNEVRARIFARFGDKDRALASLEQVLSTPSDGIFGPPVTPAILRLDPMFDPLRGDPRFEKISQEPTK
jgi:serine/threonine-protein kinase